MSGARARFPRVALLLVALAGCARASRIVREVDPGSPCSRLRASIRNLPFTDSAATEVRIPWCFPALTGAGIQGYWLDVPTPRAGRFSLTMSEVRPDTRFQLTAIAGGCLEDNTGRTEVSLGAGTSWTMEVGPGRYWGLFARTSQPPTAAGPRLPSGICGRYSMEMRP